MTAILVPPMMITDHLSAARPPAPRRRSPPARLAWAAARVPLAIVLYGMYFAFLIVSMSLAAIIWPTCSIWQWAAERWEDWRARPRGGWGFEEYDLGGRE